MGLSENREALSPPVVIVFPRKNRHFGSISFLGKLFVAGLPIWYFINGHATGTDSLEVPIPYIRPIYIYIRPKFQGISPQNIYGLKHMVPLRSSIYLDSGDLPLKFGYP